MSNPMMAKVIENFFRKVLPVDRYAFGKICRSNGLQLDYHHNKEGINVLDEIFVQRVYAPYFPFYEKATIIDVGAHFGYFSLFAALNTSSDSRILALEPSPGNFERLQKNLSKHPFKNIEVHALGLAGSSAERSLYGGPSFNHSLFDHAGATNQQTTVPTLSLADLLAQQTLQTIDFLKLDCEGAEYPILLESPVEVLTRIKVISMEFHDLQKEGYQPQQLIRHLESTGFDIRQYSFSPTYGTKASNYGKIVAVRAGKDLNSH